MEFQFEDEVVKNVDMTNASSVCQMIIEHLCGKKYYKEPSEADKRSLSDLLQKAKKRGLSYEQFNELLLLLDQDRVSEGFFRFFFGKDPLTLARLKQGVIKFKGYAMLCFGNFRFAYKQLIQKNKDELESELCPYWEKGTWKRGAANKKRPPKMLEITEIERRKTWYAGYISKRKFEKDYDYLKRLFMAKTNHHEKNTLFEELKRKYGEKYNEIYLQHLKLAERYKKKYLEIDKDISDVEQIALRNTDIYLTWDYMDVYIATSMRHKWEFEETFDFIQDIFKKKGTLKNFSLRYFDPTQSLCRNRIDKGLIEGLMLRRSFCTIYMAQESDTMGKDAELAATLAQKKPVIAYVPSEDNVEKYSKRIKQYPLDFFEKRLLILQAEEIFNDEHLVRKLHKHVPKWESIMQYFLDRLEKYRSTQPFNLVEEEEKHFKKNLQKFDQLCKILAIAESYNFEKRAKNLQEIHPLALQVDLQSGVANGVLVVRNSKDCAKLIRKILSNSMEFRIKHIKLFNLGKSEYEILCSLVNQIANKFTYDENKKTLNLIRDLTTEEINALEKFSNESICPESLRKHLKRFSLEGVTLIEEKISCSPYRVVTNDEKLTNCFWNFYLQSGRQYGKI
jgi:hypothetical protein